MDVKSFKKMIFVMGTISHLVRTRVVLKITLLLLIVSIFVSGISFWVPVAAFAGWILYAIVFQLILSYSAIKSSNRVISHIYGSDNPIDAVDHMLNHVAHTGQPIDVRTFDPDNIIEHQPATDVEPD